MSEENNENALSPRIAARLLSQERANRIVEYINDKATDPTDACPVCSSHINTVNELTFAVEAERADEALASGRNMPLYSTLCHNCGFVRFFNKILVDRKIAEEDAAIANEGGVADAST